MPQKPIDINIDLNEQLGLNRPKQTGPDAKALERAQSLLNGERGKLGLHLLQGVPTLFQVAQAHSDDMEKRGFLGDATPEGDAVSDKARRAGYEGRTETLTASGAEQPDGVLREWLGQPQYQKLLLSESMQHLGIGCNDGLWTVILGAPASAQLSDIRELRAQVLRIVNDERRRASLTLLELSDSLGTAAQAHCADMAQRDYLSTNSPDGISLAARAQKAGFAGRCVGCLTKGPLTPEEAVAAVLRTSRGNLLHPEIRFLGVAHTASRWTLLLGTK